MRAAIVFIFGIVLVIMGCDKSGQRNFEKLSEKIEKFVNPEKAAIKKFWHELNQIDFSESNNSSTTPGLVNGLSMLWETIDNTNLDDLPSDFKSAVISVKIETKNLYDFLTKPGKLSRREYEEKASKLIVKWGEKMKVLQHIAHRYDPDIKVID